MKGKKIKKALLQIMCPLLNEDDHIFIQSEEADRVLKLLQELNL